jgi:hypothetical protein
MKIKTLKPDRSWLRHARKAGITARTGNRDCPLKKALLKIGGWAAVIPNIEPDLLKILERGRRFPGRSKTMRGEPCRCHSNSALCWDENRELCRICTGYALSKDGVWRQHSWVLTNDGTVVETTEKRVQYFGYVLTEKECEEFLESNW